MGGEGSGDVVLNRINIFKSKFVILWHEWEGIPPIMRGQVEGD
jgi:hypothetical protein